MKRFCCALLLLRLLSGGAVFAQQHRISLGYGWATHDQFRTDRFDIDKTYYLNTPPDVDPKLAWEVLRRSEDVSFRNASYSEALGLQYDYLLNPNLAVGMSAAFEQKTAELEVRHKTVNRDITVGSYRRRAFTLAPEVNFTYRLPTAVKIYGTVGLGGTLILETFRGDNGSRTVASGSFAFQVSPVCLRFGRTFSGWIELGYGYKGIASLGASYQF